MAFTIPDAWDDVPFDLLVGVAMQEICLTLNELERALGRGDSSDEATLWYYMLYGHPGNTYTGTPADPVKAVYTKWPKTNSGTVATPVFEDEVTFPAPGEFDDVAHDTRVLTEIIARARTSIRFVLGLLNTGQLEHPFTHQSMDTTPGFWWNAAIAVVPAYYDGAHYLQGGQLTNAEIWTAAGRSGQTDAIKSGVWADDLVHSGGNPLGKDRLTEAIDELLDLLKLSRYACVFPSPYPPAAEAGTIPNHQTYLFDVGVKPYVMMDPNANFTTNGFVFGQGSEAPDHYHLGASEPGGDAENADDAWTDLVAGTVWRFDANGNAITLGGAKSHRIGCSIAEPNLLDEPPEANRTNSYQAAQYRVEYLAGFNPMAGWAPGGSLVKRVFVVSAYSYIDADTPIPADIDGAAILLPLAGVDTGGASNRFLVHKEITAWPGAGAYFSLNLPSSNPFLDTADRIGSQIVEQGLGVDIEVINWDPPLAPSGFANVVSSYEIRDLQGSLTHL